MNRLSLEEKIEVENVTWRVEDYRERLACGYPQHRLVKPREMGAYCVSLCREEAMRMTGQDTLIAVGSLW